MNALQEVTRWSVVLVVVLVVVIICNPQLDLQSNIGGILSIQVLINLRIIKVGSKNIGKSKQGGVLSCFFLIKIFRSDKFNNSR